MTRPVSLALGLLVLSCVWVLPLRELVPGPFSAHMTMHMGVVAVAAPLVALGVAGGRFDPVRRAPRWFPAIPLSIAELVLVWAWHAPVLHQLARHSPSFFVMEQACFLASGLLVWIAAFGGDPRERAERRATGVVALLLTSMHMTLLGALLALPVRPLYAHGHHGGSAALSPLDDQHLGGAIMLIVGGMSYLAGGLWLVADLLRERRAGGRLHRARLLDAGAGAPTAEGGDP